MIDPELVQAVEDFLQSKVRPDKQLAGGHESQVFRLQGPDGFLVLKVGPTWRTHAELKWVHAVVRHVQRNVPQAVPPMQRRGETVIEWAGRCVTVFPFIEGRSLDRDDGQMRNQAARTLAALHNALLTWSGGPRPASGRARTEANTVPAGMEKDALDRWWDSVRSRSFVTAVTHGDFYRGNVLCSNGHITGVIDWDDATVNPLVLELAGATFEFCRDDDHCLQLDRVYDFVRAYQAADGPVPKHEIEMLVPFMRLWVRSDIRSAMADADGFDLAYVKRQVRAFRRLADIRLDFDLTP